MVQKRRTPPIRVRPPVAPQYYTVRQIAQILQLTERKVRGLCRDGVIKGKKIGADWRVPISAVTALFR